MEAAVSTTGAVLRLKFVNVFGHGAFGLIDDPQPSFGVGIPRLLFLRLFFNLASIKRVAVQVDDHGLMRVGVVEVVIGAAAVVDGVFVHLVGVVEGLMDVELLLLLVLMLRRRLLSNLLLNELIVLPLL